MGDALVLTIGGIPLYSMRVFLTTFSLAVTARWITPDVFATFPGWLTSDLAIGVLAALAIIEVLAQKNPEITEVLQTFDREIKAASYLIYSGITFQSSSIGIAAEAGSFTVGDMPLWSLAWAGLSTAGVWLIARTRQSVLSTLMEIDDDDTLGIRRMISWSEDGFVVAGVVCLVIMPVLALLVSFATVGGLFFVKRWLDKKEADLLHPCAACGRPIHPSALNCGHCRATNASPVTVNWLGLPRKEPVADQQHHRLTLVSKRRCMVCATKLSKRALQQKCPTCGTVVLPSLAWFDAYITHVRAGLRRTIGICFLFGLVPVFGLIPGIVYYRFGLISNLRRYTPATIGCFARVFVRTINIGLLALQGVPIVGAIALPAMCCTNFLVYQMVVRREADRAFGATRPIPSSTDLSANSAQA